MLRQTAQFAHAQRRTRPTVTDIEQMLLSHNIDLSGLEDEMRRVPSTHPPMLQPPKIHTTDEEQFFTEQNQLRALLGNELDGATDKREYIPDHLPPLPSKHTYMATSTFTDRPKEPRVIRELATEEARLAENALRKILAASAERKVGSRKRGSDEAQLGSRSQETTTTTTTTSTTTTTTTTTTTSTTTSRRKRMRRAEVFEKAFAVGEAKKTKGVNGDAAGLTGGQAGKGKEAANGRMDTNIWLEVTVNADSHHWRGGGRKGKGRNA